MSVSSILLIILGAVCLTGLVLVMGYALNFAKPRPADPPQNAPLPGSEGGGTYLMRVERNGTEPAFSALEEALGALPGISARADASTGEVRITYKGFPGLDLLDTLRRTAEKAGFRVISVE